MEPSYTLFVKFLMWVKMYLKRCEFGTDSSQPMGIELKKIERNIWKSLENVTLKTYKLKLDILCLDLSNVQEFYIETKVYYSGAVD